MDKSRINLGYLPAYPSMGCGVFRPPPNDVLSTSVKM
nr:MAG TPA: poly(ADP-ribose) glycohydrolase [Caudoviricetes sp.]